MKSCQSDFRNSSSQDSSTVPISMKPRQIIGLAYNDVEYGEMLEKVWDNLKEKPENARYHFVHKANNLLFKRSEIQIGREDIRLVPFYRVDEFGRFHYYLTNMPRELRPFIRLNGRKLVSYDIVSSQVIFFAMVTRDESQEWIDFSPIIQEIQEWYPQFLPEGLFEKEGENKSNQLSWTLKKYRNTRLRNEIDSLFRLLEGDFYRHLMDKANWENSRDDFKQAFFEILFGPNRNCRNKVFKVFRREFPYITLLLWKIKDLGGMHRREKELSSNHPVEEDGENEKEKKTAQRREVLRLLKREAKKEGKYYVRLPRWMQKKEADFMFNKIIPNIDPENKRPFLPLHDCILVERSGRRNVKNIKRLIEDAFKKEGIKVNVKEKNW